MEKIAKNANILRRQRSNLLLRHPGIYSKFTYWDCSCIIHAKIEFNSYIYQLIKDWDRKNLDENFLKLEPFWRLILDRRPESSCSSFCFRFDMIVDKLLPLFDELIVFLLFAESWIFGRWRPTYMILKIYDESASNNKAVTKSKEIKRTLNINETELYFESKYIIISNHGLNTRWNLIFIMLSFLSYKLGVT